MTDSIQSRMLVTPKTAQSTAAFRKPGGAGAGTDQKLRQACEDFESIFVDFMLQQMRQTVPQNELFGGGKAEQLYTSMMDSELAKSISHQRGLGLADQMYRQLMATSAGKGIKDSKNY